MSEFEWRSEMRKLGGSVEPARDLWPTIEAKIAMLPNRRKPPAVDPFAGSELACRVRRGDIRVAIAYGCPGHGS